MFETPSVSSAWDLGSSWKRIITIGDIHGDLDALVIILLGTGVIDETGRWIAADTLLVLLGDIIDRGPHGTKIIPWLMAMQPDAHRNGSKLEVLLGNHELSATQGDFSYAHPAEVIALESYRHGYRTGLHAFYRGDSPYAEWIAQRPAILKANTTIFVHAALTGKTLQVSPDWINATIQSWVRYFQGLGDEPDETTSWLIEPLDNGPLWSRNYNPAAGTDWKTETAPLAAYLSTHRASLIVAGHTPTKSLDYHIAYPHPGLGDCAAVIDTGISKFYNGRPSALEIDASGIATPLYFPRKTIDFPFIRAFQYPGNG